MKLQTCKNKFTLRLQNDVRKALFLYGVKSGLVYCIIACHYIRKALTQ